MIVLQSTYTGTDDAVATLRSAHLEWLEQLVTDGLVIAAGRLEDGSGAAILGAGTDAAQLLREFEQDPYVTGGVATYAEVLTFPAAMAGDAVKAMDARA